MQIQQSNDIPAPRPPRVLVEVAEPNPSGNPAFEKFDIHLGTLDPQGLQLDSVVVQGPTDDGHPRWRPEGGALFLHRTHQADDCSGPMYEVARPEGKRKQVVPHQVSSFDVARQGNRMAFVLTSPDAAAPYGPSQLWISCSDGERAREIPLPEAFEPREVAFTADGRKLLFTSRLFNPEPNGDEKAGLYSYDLRTRRLNRYTGTDCHNPAAAPDGHLVAYTKDHSLHCLDVHTQRDRVMAHLDAYGSWVSPVFSPDGQHLYYCDDGDLMVMPTKGGVPRCLAHGIGSVAFEPG